MRCTIAAVVVALTGACGVASADLTFPPISGLPVGPGLGFANFTNPPAPTISNNDIPGLEQIYPVHVNKRFDAAAVIDSPIMLNLNAMSGSPPVTGVEYSIDEVVTNNSGVTWTGFRMELGENVLAAFGPYTNAMIAVTFDVPNQNPAPICSAFSIVNIHAPHVLEFTGGSLPHGSSMAIRFQIDNLTPNDINGDGQIDQADLYGITLREFPLVPAPGAVALAGMGGLLTIRRRR